jgi:hypothetical protein
MPPPPPDTDQQAGGGGSSGNSAFYSLKHVPKYGEIAAQVNAVWLAASAYRLDFISIYRLYFC